MKRIKRILNFSCLLTAFVLCSCSSKTDSLKEYNLKGNVYSIDIKTYRAESKFGKVEKGNLMASYEGLCAYLVFENRYLQEETIFDWEGEIGKKNIYKYDLDNNPIGIDGYNSDGSLDEKTTYKWKDEKLIEIRKTDSENKEVFKIVQEFDGGKYPSRSIFYYEGVKRSERINTYKGDKLISYEEIDENGKKTVHEYKYDGDLCVEANIYHPMKIKYDEEGNPTEVLGGQVTPMGYWTTQEGAKDEVYYYEYKYDTKGNWIERIEYKGKNKKPENIVEREITYM